MQFARKRRARPAINIINLIDILVVLLIFYITTTIFKRAQPRINIVVPSSSHAKAAADTPPAIIYVTADNKIFLDAAPVEPEELGDQLKHRLQADPAFKVAMKADTKASFGVITKVLDAAHTAGIADLPTFMDAKPGGGGPDAGGGSGGAAP